MPTFCQPCQSRSKNRSHAPAGLERRWPNDVESTSSGRLRIRPHFIFHISRPLFLSLFVCLASPLALSPSPFISSLCPFTFLLSPPPSPSDTSLSPQVDDKLRSVLCLLKYVQNKDVFMRYHKGHLSRRLILDTSADSEKEENMVDWLRGIGMPADYVNKLSRMFQASGGLHGLLTAFRIFVGKRTRTSNVGMLLKVFLAFTRIVDMVVLMSTGHLRLCLSH